VHELRHELVLSCKERGHQLGVVHQGHDAVVDQRAYLSIYAVSTKHMRTFIHATHTVDERVQVIITSKLYANTGISSELRSKTESLAARKNDKLTNVMGVIRLNLVPFLITFLTSAIQGVEACNATRG
jgi:hypothetical protein